MENVVTVLWNVLLVLAVLALMGAALIWTLRPLRDRAVQRATTALVEDIDGQLGRRTQQRRRAARGPRGPRRVAQSRSVARGPRR